MKTTTDTSISDHQKEMALETVKSLVRGNDELDEWAVSREGGGIVRGKFYVKQESFDGAIRLDVVDSPVELVSILQVRDNSVEIDFDHRTVRYALTMVFEGDRNGN